MGSAPLQTEQPGKQHLFGRSTAFSSVGRYHLGQFLLFYDLPVDYAWEEPRLAVVAVSLWWHLLPFYVYGHCLIVFAWFVISSFPVCSGVLHRPTQAWTVKECSSCIGGLYKGRDKNGFLRSNEEVFLGLNPNGTSEKTDVGIAGHVTLCFLAGIRHHGGIMEEAVSGVGCIVICRLMKTLCGHKKKTKRE